MSKGRRQSIGVTGHPRREVPEAGVGHGDAYTQKQEHTFSRGSLRFEGPEDQGEGREQQEDPLGQPGERTAATLAARATASHRKGKGESTDHRRQGESCWEDTINP